MDLPGGWFPAPQPTPFYMTCFYDPSVTVSQRHPAGVSTVLKVPLYTEPSSASTRNNCLLSRRATCDQSAETFNLAGYVIAILHHNGVRALSRQNRRGKKKRGTQNIDDGSEFHVSPPTCHQNEVGSPIADAPKRSEWRLTTSPDLRLNGSPRPVELIEPSNPVKPA